MDKWIELRRKMCGRSPKDVDDQITYPLTTALMGVPGVKTVRSYSMFGFSSIYIIFDEKIDFYWSRSRVLEKLNALPQGVLPEGVQPTLGPDATALGQVFWYTLEGRDKNDKPTGGWDLDELRSTHDWLVRYAEPAASCMPCETNTELSFFCSFFISLSNTMSNNSR